MAKMKFLNFINRIIRFPFNVIRYIAGRIKFAEFGRHSAISHPLRITGSKNIHIGRNVLIYSKAWISANPITGFTPELIISDNISIGDFAHIVASRRIVIGPDVLIANHVYISDNLHCYEDPEIPVRWQPINQCNDVYIGEGSWIGENVCIIGASLGKHCVIGANSVVTHDIPDFCVAVGAPARVIKKFDFEKNVWVRV